MITKLRNIITLARTWVVVVKYDTEVCIWDRFREKGPSAYYKICYKSALCLNRCNSRTVHAIDFLFSTRHTTPFQYVKYIVASCTNSAPTLQDPIAHGVQKRHIFR